MAPDLVLTNWHVIAPALPNGDWHARDFVCRFDYAVRNGATGEGRAVRLADDWQVAISPLSASELGKGNGAPTPATLDYALLRLQSRIGDEPGPNGSTRGWVEISSKNKIAADAKATVIVVQHPAGYPVRAVEA